MGWGGGSKGAGSFVTIHIEFLTGLIPSESSAKVSPDGFVFHNSCQSMLARYTVIPQIAAAVYSAATCRETTPHAKI